MTKKSQRTHLLWAKSDASGRPHSLPGHLLDAAAVAELIWDEYLSRAAQEMLDSMGGGHGRDLLVMVAGLHDVGKATPAFQSKSVVVDIPEIKEAHERLALPGLRGGSRTRQNWYHGPAGSVIVSGYLDRVDQASLSWILPVIEGHHGKFGRAPTKPPKHWINAHGGSEWAEAQQELVEEVLEAVDVDPAGWSTTLPSRGLQLAFAGLIVMADWIASSDLFPGLGLVPASIEEARERARRAWDALALRRGWHDLPPAPNNVSSAEFFNGRFGFPPRPLQEGIMDVVNGLDDAGLIIVEAPMGEGKTEAAEIAVELLAKMYGFGGFLLCMPTQGTTDAMYHRVTKWSDTVDLSVPVTLLHGKAALNEEWLERSKGIQFGEVYSHEDEFGMDEDPYGWRGSASSAVSAPSAWFQGRHRGLLSPAVVATVDQGLWAGTRTRFVALRHAGLLGKIVVIDEVHAYDAWMSVFLNELLRWCARMGTPVILMSATLPPKVRTALIDAWCQGAGRVAPRFLKQAGYPVITGLSRTRETVVAVEQFRSDQPVRVAVPGVGVDDAGEIASLAEELVRDGGCTLVVLNQVTRAQETWQRLVERGVPALLIHGRFAAAERARRTEEALELLGTGGNRPTKMVVVATQIAEQSFDVDADVLITDIAPMDLLLQRIGRLHRHEANTDRRPAHLNVPRVYVTGVVLDGEPPVFPKAFTHIYRDWTLLETAAALGGGDVEWAVPSQVPDLVAQAYDDEWRGPESWRARVESARANEAAEERRRTDTAATFRLDADLDLVHEDLSDLHRLGPASASEEESAMVRDGIDTQEVIVVRWRDGQYWTLAGRPLQDRGQRVSDPKIAREILGDTVRMRNYLAKEIGPLSEWLDKPLLAHMPVLVLDDSGPKKIGIWSVWYDDDLGLVVKK